MIKDIDLICRLNKNWRRDCIRMKKAGGQTNRNYIVGFEKKKYFVRLPWGEKDIINRKIESRNIAALISNNKLRRILPEYYIYILNGRNILSSEKEKFDLPDGTMVTEYIPGKVFKAPLFKKKKYQERLARMFRIFHTSGIRLVNKYNVFRDEIEKYKLAAKKYPIKKILNAETVSNLEKMEKKIKSEIPFSAKGVPSHNDFIFQNFLIGDDKKIYLLDFEYAGLNTRGGILYDFAFLFADNLFRKPPINKEIFEEFLKIADRIYKKSLNRNQIYSLAMAVPVMQIWWGLLRYFSAKTQKEKKYFKEYITKRVKEINNIYKLTKKGLRDLNPGEMAYNIHYSF